MVLEGLRLRLKISMVVLVMLLLAACGSKSAAYGALTHRSQADVMAWIDDYAPQIRNAAKQLSFSQLLAQLQTQRVVFVGERHDRYDHHLNQLALLRGLHRLNPDLAIGVEWFQEPFQPVLDAYLSGEITEITMLRESGYLDRWGYDYRMMRPIMVYAKEHGIPVIALNAATELTRKVGSGGLAALTPEERSRLPAEIGMPPEAELAPLRAVFDLHPTGEDGNFEGFVMVQRIWDITMAQNIVKHLQANPQRSMLVFAGDGHVGRDRAIPAEVKARLPGIKTAVVHSMLEQRTWMDEDFLILSRPSELPATGKLGVWLDDAEGGALVQSVVEASAAAEAGLIAGNVIIEINSGKTPDSLSLKLALSNYAPGDLVMIKVMESVTERREREVAITLK